MKIQLSAPCKAGKYITPGNKTCVPCKGNSFSSEGASSCTTCRPGTVAIDDNSQCGEYYWGEHFLKLVLNCCGLGPELLRASLIYTSAQQFRTRNAAI